MTTTGHHAGYCFRRVGDARPSADRSGQGLSATDAIAIALGVPGKVFTRLDYAARDAARAMAA